VIIFNSVRFLLKKNNETKKNLKKETEPKPVQIDWFQFGSVFLGQKLVQTILARFFSGLAWFFFRFGFGSVWFFWFRLIKPKPNRSVFQNFNRFNWIFFTVRFFLLFFFSGFLGLISFLVFLLTPSKPVQKIF